MVGFAPFNERNRLGSKEYNKVASSAIQITSILLDLFLKRVMCLLFLNDNTPFKKFKNTVVRLSLLKGIPPCYLQKWIFGSENYGEKNWNTPFK